MMIKILLSLLLLGLAACRPPDTTRTLSNGQSQGITVAIAPVSSPRIGEMPITVTVRHGDTPITDATVEVTGDMTHAGMVPVISSTQLTEDGSYQTTEFSFTMAGDWILIAEVRLPSGERLQAERPVNVPAP
jgi:hypothetical protein